MKEEKIIRRLVSLDNALQNFGSSEEVRKAHYLGNISVFTFFILKLYFFVFFNNLMIITFSSSFRVQFDALRTNRRTLPKRCTSR